MAPLWRRRADPEGNRDAEFSAYYAARGDHIRNTAYLMCGDWHLAGDLTQLTFTKIYRRWRHIERHDALDQYARRVLLRALLDERRRPWRREYPTGDPAELDQPVLDLEPEDHRHLHLALAAVPSRQRAALVLRYWADLSVDQIADVLGCSPGTVKSQTSRGLDNLRRALGTARSETRLQAGGSR
jgi:RNA polymerase sigma-70 factor (sigma-E family)